MGRWIKHTIKSGKHNCLSFPRIRFNRRAIEFEFKVDDTWYYYPPKNNGWSKICGFSQGGRHWNSARLTFRCIELDGQLVLQAGAYCYTDGNKPSSKTGTKKVIGELPPGKYHCRIDRGIFFYHFNLFGTDSQFYSRCPAGQRRNWRSFISIVLDPYIGGEFTLNKKFVAFLKIIKF